LNVQYIGMIAYKTFPINSGLQSVPPEWEMEDPKEFYSVVEKFHNLAGEIYYVHQDFIKTARRKLNV